MMIALGIQESIYAPVSHYMLTKCVSQIEVNVRSPVVKMDKEESHPQGLTDLARAGQED
jgi:hypothetical protein